MRAENLTITVPSVVHNDKLKNPYCNKNCPYCISVMTGFAERSHISHMLRNIDKVLTFAERAQVTSVLLTGKGEPTLNMPDIKTLAQHFRHYSLELQTNGLILSQHLYLVTELYNSGFDIIAISIDREADFKRFVPLIDAINSTGMSVRLTVNVSDMLKSYNNFRDIHFFCQDHNVPQLLFRKLSVPGKTNELGIIQWIEDHANDGSYENILSMIELDIKRTNAKVLTRINTGEAIYDLDGVAVVSIDYCIQEESTGEDLRSIIFHEDGHLYTSWNSKASIRF